jgi:hypothetical protein
MHRSMTLTALVTIYVLTSVLLVEKALAEIRTVYPATYIDQRVARCGITVSGDEIGRIEPFLDGHSDLMGRLEFDVTKRSPFGQSQSRQAVSFSGGKLRTAMISMEGPAEMDIVLSVKDRSGKTLCAMRRSIILGSIPFQI